MIGRGAGGQVPFGLCRDDIGGIFCVVYIADKVIRIVEGHKAFGVFGCDENLAGVFNADGLVNRAVQHQQGNF